MLYLESKNVYGHWEVEWLFKGREMSYLGKLPGIVIGKGHVYQTSRLC